MGVWDARSSLKPDNSRIPSKFPREKKCSDGRESYGVWVKKGRREGEGRWRKEGFMQPSKGGNHITWHSFTDRLSTTQHDVSRTPRCCGTCYQPVISDRERFE